jgi:hypothetical protein
MFAWTQNIAEPKYVGSDNSLDPCLFMLHVDDPKYVGPRILLDSCLLGLSTWLNPSMLDLTTRQIHVHLDSIIRSF